MTPHVIHVGVGHESPWLATSYVYGQVNGGLLDTTVKMKHESTVARRLKFRSEVAYSHRYQGNQQAARNLVSWDFRGKTQDVLLAGSRTTLVAWFVPVF